MIFQSAFLASLLAASASAALTTETVKSKDVQIKDMKKAMKAQIHEKFSAPTSMSGKLEKFQKIQAKPSTINLETATFDEAPSHLRGLKMRDNFLSITGFSDDQCTMPQYQYGALVNACTNEQGTNTGEKRSTLIKVNKKEGVVVELEYAGYDCKGVPTKVSNLFDELPGWSWGGCVLDDSDDEAVYLRVDYLSTYPTPAASSLISRTFPDGMCSADNMNYIEFMSFPLTYNTCQPSMQPGYWDIYFDDDCASSGQLVVRSYSDVACTQLVVTIVYPGYYCSPPDVDDNNDDIDDDDFALVGVTEGFQFCT